MRAYGEPGPWRERLLLYRAPPPFALGRLEQLADDQLVYRFPRPQPDGATQLHLTPLELIERPAALIPPHLHRHRTVEPSIPGLARSCFALLPSHSQRSTHLAWRSYWQLSGVDF
jgi:hypothetical protein